MKKYFNFNIVALILPGFLLILFLCGCSSGSIEVNAGEPAPVARLYMLSGEIKSTSDYQGRDLILFFWASTCGHSYSVLEDLVSWQRNSPAARKTSIVSVSIDKADKEDKLRELISGLERNRIEFAFSGNDIYDEAYVAFDVGELPTLVRVDANGKLKSAGTSVGAVTD